jgi:hypothetical protein
MSPERASNVPRRPPIGRRPAADPASVWVHKDEQTAATSKATPFTARLTIDITPALRARIKLAAIRRAVTAADMLRELLEREFPESMP